MDFSSNCNVCVSRVPREFAEAIGPDPIEGAIQAAVIDRRQGDAVEPVRL
jgi:hypothetical protein